MHDAVIRFLVTFVVLHPGSDALSVNPTQVKLSIYSVKGYFLLYQAQVNWAASYAFPRIFVNSTEHQRKNRQYAFTHEAITQCGFQPNFVEKPGKEHSCLSISSF